MSEPPAVPLPAAPSPRRQPIVRIDPRWWSLGVVDAFNRRKPQPGVADQFSYISGRVEGEAARLRGHSLDSVLEKSRVPFREADFRPLPPLVGPRKDAP